MASKEFDPQGPHVYSGTICWSEKGEGIIAIYGPTLDKNNKITFGEIIHINPPGRKGHVRTNLKYSEIEKHLGGSIMLMRYYPESNGPSFMVSGFRIEKKKSLS